MNRRNFLASLGGLVVAGPPALEALERINWKRRFFPSASIARPWLTANHMRVTHWVNPIDVTTLGSRTRTYEPCQHHCEIQVSDDGASWRTLPSHVTLLAPENASEPPRYHIRPADFAGPIIHVQRFP